MGVTPTFPVVTLSPSTKIIYKWPILAAVYYTNPLTVTPNPLYLFLILYLIKVINKSKVLVYNCP